MLFAASGCGSASDTAGVSTLSPLACSFDPPIPDPGANTPGVFYTPQLALGSDGNVLYVGVDGSSILRYTRDASGGCAWTEDASFGTLGSLPQQVDDLQVDDGGHVWVVGGGSLQKIWPAPSMACGGGGAAFASGALAVSRDGSVGYVGTTVKAQLGASACSTGAWPAQPTTVNAGYEALDDAGRVHLADTVVDNTGFNIGRVEVLAPDGASVKVYGNASDPMAPDGLCSVDGIAACGASMCVVDANCRAIKRFSKDGALEARHDFGSSLDASGLAAGLACSTSGACLLVLTGSGSGGSEPLSIVEVDGL